MELTKETRDRIFAAADALFEQNGRDSFPTVDAVRKAARVNMNDASSGMKEWRRAQTAQAAPVAVQVPEAVQAAGGQAVAVLWQQAQELANESLRAAQAGWEVERAELDTMRQELADAYESQAAELDRVQLTAEAADKAHQAQSQQAAAELATVRAELAQAVTRAERAEAKTDEIERRAGDLRAELDRAHKDADQMRATVTEAQHAAQAAAAQLDQVRAELAALKAKAEAEREAHQEQRKAAAQEAAHQAERYTKAQAERDQAREEASNARERAAELTGQLIAQKEQAAALLARLAPAEAKAPRGKK